MTRKQAIMALLCAPAVAIAQMPPTPGQRSAVLPVPQPTRPAPIISIGLGETVPDFTNAAWIAGVEVQHGNERIWLSADDIWEALTRETWPVRR